MTSEDHPPKRRRVGATLSGRVRLLTQTPVRADSRSTAEGELKQESHQAAPLSDKVKAEDSGQAAQTAEAAAVPEAKGIDQATGDKRFASDEALRPGAFTQRELFFQQQEASGSVTFQYVENDGDPDHGIWLLALKNIFSKQLPNMPKEYITRLVFDRRHRSVAVIRQDGTVVGGITYRPFHAQAFGEIAFCAVSATDQVKGFGSRLMSYTKEFAKERDSLSHFLTYADNNAVTFFAKQGFTTEVTLERERWFGYIKDYDGGTLMESVLYPELPYIRIPQMLQAQRAALNSEIRAFVYPGLRHFSDENAPPLDIEEIPGVKEAGWEKDAQEQPSYMLVVDGEGELPPTQAAIHKLGSAALAALKAHEDSPAFLRPVIAEEVPDYYDIIKDPIDISKIEGRLARNNVYVTLDLFKADVNRIWRNAQVYNAVDTYWYKAAGRLQTFFEHFLASHVVVRESGALLNPL